MLNILNYKVQNIVYVMQYRTVYYFRLDFVGDRVGHVT